MQFVFQQRNPPPWKTHNIINKYSLKCSRCYRPATYTILFQSSVDCPNVTKCTSMTSFFCHSTLHMNSISSCPISCSLHYKHLSGCANSSMPSIVTTVLSSRSQLRPRLQSAMAATKITKGTSSFLFFISISSKSFMASCPYETSQLSLLLNHLVSK